MPTKQLEGKIAAGQVVIAEEVREEVLGHSSLVLGQDNEGQRTNDKGHRAQPVGYCIGHDQYFKRDDVGIIYQLNVAPGKQRGLIGATLLKAVFERAAYGCRLFCCWCAQDIEANRFWEAVGFVPLAFRAGSAGRSRAEPRPPTKEKGGRAGLCALSCPRTQSPAPPRLHGGPPSIHRRPGDPP